MTEARREYERLLRKLATIPDDDSAESEAASDEVRDESDKWWCAMTGEERQECRVIAATLNRERDNGDDKGTA